MLSFALLFALPVAPLDTTVLAPSQDNTIYENSGASNGAGDYIFAGRTAGGVLRRALIQFDFTGQIPAGSRITSVELELSLSQSSVGAKTMTLHRALASWGEGASDAILMEGTGAPAEPGDATWALRFSPGTPWGTQGGDFAPTASASFSAAGIGTYTIASTPGLVANVQSWVDAPPNNFGWILRGSETTGKSAKRFDSRSLASGPKLTVTFDPPPSLASETTTISLSAGGTQPMSLFEDPAKAGDFYWVFGSVTGTSPGIPFGGGVLLPLNFDPYFNLTLTKPFLGIFGAFLGVLDASGRATPSLTIPAGSDPGLAGVVLYHAVVTTSVIGTAEAATGAIDVTLVP